MFSLYLVASRSFSAKSKLKIMNKNFFYLLVIASGVVLFAAFNPAGNNGFKVGTPEIKSVSALTFSPDGVLFIGDSRSATVFAVNTKEAKAKKQAGNAEVKNIDQKIAAALGADVKNITITDMAVHPLSKTIYLAVQSGDGTPVLLTLDGDQVKPFSLQNVTYSSVAINNAPAEDAKDQRGRPLRVSSISDIGFSDGQLMVSGLSNHEFSSSFKSIPYPFTDKQHEATLEIYHGAHGRYETSAPIRTFTTTTIGGKKYLVASYTCTPLVLFPLNELKPGQHVKGRTVAEMGSGNSPIDMITLNQEKAPYLVMSNTRYPVAKVDYKNIAAFEGTLTERVQGTAGVAFTATPLTNVLQMDKLDDTRVVMIQRKSSGDVDLWTANESSL
jgi:hypothetical protein